MVGQVRPCGQPNGPYNTPELIFTLQNFCSWNLIVHRLIYYHWSKDMELGPKVSSTSQESFASMKSTLYMISYSNSNKTLLVPKNLTCQNTCTHKHTHTQMQPQTNISTALACRVSQTLLMYLLPREWSLHKIDAKKMLTTYSQRPISLIGTFLSMSWQRLRDQTLHYLKSSEHKEIGIVNPTCLEQN